jgi:DDE superfamily endonuclease
MNSGDVATAVRSGWARTPPNPRPGSTLPAMTPYGYWNISARTGGATSSVPVSRRCGRSSCRTTTATRRAGCGGAPTTRVGCRPRRARSSLLTKAADGPIGLVVDVSPWLRSDANTSPERSFCHTYGRGKDDDPDILVVLDAGYDAPRIAHLLGDLPVEILGRTRSDRVLHRPTPPRMPGTNGRPPKHGDEFVFGNHATWGVEHALTTTSTRLYGTATARAWDRLHPRLTRRAAGSTTTDHYLSSKAPSSGSRLIICPAAATRTRSGCGGPKPVPQRRMSTAAGACSCAALGETAPRPSDLPPHASTPAR